MTGLIFFEVGKCSCHIWMFITSLSFHHISSISSWRYIYSSQWWIKVARQIKETPEQSSTLPLSNNRLSSSSKSLLRSEYIFLHLFLWLCLTNSITRLVVSEFKGVNILILLSAWVVGSDDYSTQIMGKKSESIG